MTKDMLLQMLDMYQDMAAQSERVIRLCLENIRAISDKLKEAE